MTDILNNGHMKKKTSVQPKRDQAVRADRVTSGNWGKPYLAL